MPTSDHATSDAIHRVILDAWLRELDETKRRCDLAIGQLDDTLLNARPDTRMNSVAMIVAHLSGNLRSRFHEFLTTDGEKPDRNRDREFDPTPHQREPLLRTWNEAWVIARREIAALQPDDLLRTIRIRGEPHTVPRAIERAIAHWAYHCGQILLISRLLKGEGWQWITIPPGKSQHHNQRMHEHWDNA